MKVCTKCKKEKVVSDFSKSSRSNTGLHPQCKSCKNASQRDWARRNHEHCVQYSRKRYQENKELYKKYREKYTKNNPEKVKRAKAKYQSKQRKIEKEKFRARNLIAMDIRYGKLQSQVCEEVGCERLGEAHHDDYSKPREVRWLCPSHHAEHHRLERIANEQRK